MEDLENSSRRRREMPDNRGLSVAWLRNLLKQKEQDDTAWFLNRPSLRFEKEKEMKGLA